MTTRFSKYALALQLMLCMNLISLGQVYFIEQDKSPSSSSVANLTSQERKVWIVDNKAKILSRSTKEGTQEAANMSVNTNLYVVNNSQSNFQAAADKEIQIKELTISQMKSQKNPDKKKIAELETELKAAKEERKRMQSNSEVNSAFESQQEKATIQINQIDKDALSQDIQKESGNAHIIRLDKGVIWKINTAELTCKENKIEPIVSGKDGAPVMPAGLYSVTVQDLGDGGIIAGYSTKKYKLKVVMSTGGTVVPYFSGEVWVAEELENAKLQVNKFNNEYKQKVGVSALPPLNVNAVIFDMVPEFNDKLNSLKGMILKKLYKGDGHMSATVYATEIIKVTTAPIDYTTFELPAAVKKQK